ncbi:MAG: beta-lactamase family protein [Taibaiella sp.]|nr:beta-lactamase family protein [Taibaiella sp.]
MKKWLTAVCIMFALAGNIHAQDKPRELDSIVLHWTALGKYSGTILVAQKDKILLHKGYGIISHHQEGKRPDENTLYITGGLTEMFTSALVFRLQEEGKLSIKDTLSKYLPEFPFSNKVTIGHLLSHTSGIDDYMMDDSLYMMGTTTPRERKDITGIIKRMPLSSEPGKEYKPSASNYFLLGMVVEKVTGTGYYEAMHKYIITPLGMKNTGFNYGGFGSWDKSQGYSILNYQRMLPAFPVDSTVSFASGALFTSTKGMQKLAQAMLGNKLLKKSSWQTMTTAQVDSFAYGFEVRELAGRKAIGHTAETYGYVHCFYVLPEDSTVIVILSNDFESEIFYILDDIIAVLYNQPYTLPKPRSSVFLEEARLKHYEGRYEFENGMDLNVYARDKLLWGKMNGGQEFTMLADVIPEEFFMSSADVEFRFVRDRKTNLVTHIIIRQNRKEITGKKWQ